MLAVKHFRETPGMGSCGPAALKMVLGYFGIEKSEAELIRLCRWTKTLGTSSSNMVAAAARMGLRGRVKDFATLRDIRRYVREKKVPVIVAWFSEDYGHYSVVVDIDDATITLDDPQMDEGVLRMDLVTFQQVWFDYLGKYPKRQKDFVIRRMIIIEPKTRRQ